MRHASLARRVGLVLVTAYAGLLVVTAANAQVPSSALQKCRDVWEGGFDVGIDSFGGSDSDADAAVNTALADAAAFYSGVGFSAPVLQCFDDPDSGETRYAMHYDADMHNNLGDYESTRCGGGSAKARLNSLEIPKHYGLMISGATADSGRIGTPPHELFHGVQSSYDMFSLCPEDWVWEGLAEALAYIWLQNYGPRNRQYKISMGRTIRYIDYPLHEPYAKDDDNGHAYGTALFWEYLTREPKLAVGDETVSLGLSRRFDPALLERFMDMRGNDSETYQSFAGATAAPDHWELRWLDKMLADLFNERLKRGQVEGGVYVVYPKFAAWLVNFVEPGQLKHFFKAGCGAVTLSEDQPVSHGVTVRRVASACLAISFGDNSDNKGFMVTMAGATKDTTRLHLGVNGEVISASRQDDSRKTWLVLPPPDQETVYLALSNVSPVAVRSEDLSVSLSFQYAHKGEASGP